MELDSRNFRFPPVSVFEEVRRISQMSIKVFAVLVTNDQGIEQQVAAAPLSGQIVDYLIGGMRKGID